MKYILLLIWQVVGFVIINYAKTARFRDILTSALALNDPQNPLFNTFRE